MYHKWRGIEIHISDNNNVKSIIVQRAIYLYYVFSLEKKQKYSYES